MDNPEEVKTLLEAPLELDSDEADRTFEGGTVWDKEVSESRFMLYKEDTVPTTGEEPNLDYYQLTFICSTQPHPNLTLQWAELTINFDQTRGSLIRQLEPSFLPGDKPVELKSTFALKAKLEFIPVEIGPEFSTSRTVYPPKLSGLGAGSQKARWLFQPSDTGSLYLNQELKLLVSAPKGAQLEAYFNFKAKLSRTGLAKLIPVIGSGKPIEEIYRLN
jgi:hypothetical protein